METWLKIEGKSLRFNLRASFIVLLDGRIWNYQPMIKKNLVYSFGTLTSTHPQGFNIHCFTVALCVNRKLETGCQDKILEILPEPDSSSYELALINQKCNISKIEILELGILLIANILILKLNVLLFINE